MFNPLCGNQGIDMFMSGENLAAKSTARLLAKELGFENCYDFGGSGIFFARTICLELEQPRHNARSRQKLCIQNCEARKNTTI